MNQMAHPHTPEEVARLSTLGHNLIGWLLLAAALAMLFEVVRGLPAHRGRYLWPGIAIIVGFGLAGFLLVHFPLTHRVSPFVDPAQAQHIAIGITLGLGGVVEVMRRRRRAGGARWEAPWPLALVGVGCVFLAHEQGTAEALLVHWFLAATLIVAGLAGFAAALAGEARAMRLFGVLVLAAASLQLIVFVEKPGAHGGHGAPAADHAGH